MKNITKKSVLNFLPSLTKDFILAYRIAVFGIAIAGCLFLKFSITQEQSKIEEKIITSTAQIEKIFTSDLSYIKYQMHYASKQIKETNADQKKIEKLLSTFVTNVNNQIDIATTWNAFSWINSSNKVTIDGVAGILSKPIDVSNRDYLKLTQDNPGKLIFGKAVNGALSGRLIIPAGIGILSERGTYLGTLVFGFDIEKILTKLRSASEGGNINFAILRNGEISFTSSNLSNEDLIAIKQNLEKENPSLLEKKTLSTQSIFSKNNSFTYFQKMHGYPFEIIAIYDKEKSYEQISNLFFKQILLILLIVFSCIILFKIIYRRVVEPISKLSNFALEVSERNFAFNIEKPKEKELLYLYNALNLVKDAFEREELLLRQLQLANQKISTENFNKSEFLAAISHDIRNPLSAIVSFSHFIQDDKEASANEIAEWSRDIEQCASDVLQFINDLMDVNQIASGEFSINMSQKIDIAETIRRSIRINRDFAQRRRIEIVSEVANDISSINLDVRRMKQILVNLINNSIKYSREGTKIEIAVKRIFEASQAKLQIIVKDHGFGMSEDQLKKALQKYGRIQNENSDKVDSFGLGLPLVKYLTEAQKGTIAIESLSGVGTKIILTFNY